MALGILELVSGIADFWLWFSLTGSCVVWVVTLGQVWLVDDHPHWAALVGIMLHIVVLVVVAAYFWNASEEEKRKQKPEAGKQVAALSAFVR